VYIRPLLSEFSLTRNEDSSEPLDRMIACFCLDCTTINCSRSRSSASISTTFPLSHSNHLQRPAVQIQHFNTLYNKHSRCLRHTVYVFTSKLHILILSVMFLQNHHIHLQPSAINSCYPNASRSANGTPTTSSTISRPPLPSKDLHCCCSAD